MSSMFEACSGEAKFDEIAQRLGMSRRTLARRLKAQALSFGEILKQFRSDLIIRSTMMSHYSAAKAAVITFTPRARHGLGPQGRAGVAFRMVLVQPQRYCSASAGQTRRSFR